MTGRLATILAGSADLFERQGVTATRSVNFLAAHDGFTLADLVAYEHRHNDANGENNRDGHAENFSWNNGVEGPSDDPAVLAARHRDLEAALSLLFASRGTLLLTAGDEGGRSQQGNNNAYAQDNAITWLDWQGFDETLVSQTAFLAGLRRRFAALSETHFLTGQGDVCWLTPEGEAMSVSDWENPGSPALMMVLKTADRLSGRDSTLAVLINLRRTGRSFTLPAGDWLRLQADVSAPVGPVLDLPPMNITFLLDDEAEPGRSTGAPVSL